MRRIVTGHDDKGVSIIAKDDEIERLDVTPEHATFAVRCRTLSYFRSFPEPDGSNSQSLALLPIE